MFFAPMLRAGLHLVGVDLPQAVYFLVVPPKVGQGSQELGLFYVGNAHHRAAFFCLLGHYRQRQHPQRKDKYFEYVHCFVFKRRVRPGTFGG